MTADLSAVYVEAPLWHCANPRCHSYKRGRPRVLLAGTLGRGSCVPRRCPECGRETTFCVDTDGRAESRLTLGTASDKGGCQER